MFVDLGKHQGSLKNSRKSLAVTKTINVFSCVAGACSHRTISIFVFAIGDVGKGVVCCRFPNQEKFVEK